MGRFCCLVLWAFLGFVLLVVAACSGVGAPEGTREEAGVAKEPVVSDPVQPSPSVREGGGLSAGEGVGEPVGEEPAVEEPLVKEPVVSDSVRPSPSVGVGGGLAPSGIGFTRFGVDGFQETFVVDVNGGDLWLVTSGSLRVVWSPDGSRLAVIHSGRVVVVGADGSSETIVIDTPHHPWSVTWSPDGASLSYVVRSSSLPNQGELFVVGVDGGNPRSLAVLQFNGGVFHVWSPDSSRIAVAGKRQSDQRDEVLVVNADGSGILALTDYDPADSRVVWSPDGTHLAYYSESDPASYPSDGVIVVVAADGSNPRVISSDHPLPQQIEWSADGSRVAIQTYFDDELLLARSDGRGLVHVGHAAESTVAWSPDGARLAFRGHTDLSEWNWRETALLVVDADGSNHQRLTDSGWRGTFEWSPDSTRVVFCSGSLWVFDTTNEYRRRLSDETASCENPIWSPDGARIAFEVTGGDDGHEIFVVDVTDSRLQSLTASPGHIRDVRWSPDSTRLLFTALYDARVFVMDPDGSNQRPLTHSYSYGPMWSPDGYRVAFKRPNEILVVDREGRNLVNTGAQPQTSPIFINTSDPWGPIRHVPADFDMAWSPDSAMIAYTSLDEVFVASAEGGRQTRIVEGAGGDDFRWFRDLSWSPDGNAVAYLTETGRIFVADAAGGTKKELTQGRDPAWSPDSGQILFASRGSIFVSDPDGSNQQQLTNGNPRAQDPVWSPDGTRIAYVGESSDDTEVFVMDADGSNQRQLTDNESVDVRPAWSPDGSRLVFMGYSDGDWEIYVVEVDEGTVQQLTDNPYQDYDPQWIPAPTKG